MQENRQTSFVCVIVSNQPKFCRVKKSTFSLHFESSLNQLDLSSFLDQTWQKKMMNLCLCYVITSLLLVMNEVHTACYSGCSLSCCGNTVVVKFAVFIVLQFLVWMILHGVKNGMQPLFTSERLFMSFSFFEAGCWIKM